LLVERDHEERDSDFSHSLIQRRPSQRKKGKRKGGGKKRKESYNVAGPFSSWRATNGKKEEKTWKIVPSRSPLGVLAKREGGGGKRGERGKRDCPIFLFPGMGKGGKNSIGAL